MSYQIPAKVQIFQCQESGEKSLCMFTPEKDVKLKHVIVTMFLKGLLSQSTLIGCRVYRDPSKSSLLIESLPVLVSDITRTEENWYGEVRFDFNTNKSYVIGHSYYLEFFIDYASYNYDEDNYVGLILDHDSPLATIDETKRVVRHSCFFQKL